MKKPLQVLAVTADAFVLLGRPAEFDQLSGTLRRGDTRRLLPAAGLQCI